MDFNFLRRQRSGMVGLDISSGLVKLLELAQGAEGYQVESYAIEYLPAEAMQDKEIKNIDEVGAAIERVVKRSRTTLKQAAVAVAGSAVITKIIQMIPGLNEKEMIIQVQLEAERHIPYPLQDVNIDFQILGPSHKNPELIDVLLAASRKEILDTLVEVINIGGLQAKVVDVEVYAMQRAFPLVALQLPNNGEKQMIAIVNIGSTSTSFSVVNDFSVIYTREQNFGGKQLTEEIQRRYGLTFEEANLAKKQGGLPDDYEVEVLNPFKEAVVQQLSRAVQFFFSSSQFSEIDHIILIGGTSSIMGLPHKVEESLNIPTILGNPFLNMSISPKINTLALQADASSLIICCGLAMRSFL